MKTWEKLGNVAAVGVFGWLMWYELRCPGCRAEAERAGALKARQRHESNHKKGIRA